MNHENLWAPRRMTYLRELTRKAEAAGDVEPSPGPFLSDYFKHPQNDEKHHVVHRNEHGIILLNLYPYTCGHLLVALGEPRPTLLDYEPAQRVEFWKLIEVGTDLVDRTYHPQGINIGINQGAAAGAGAPDHLHAHLIPRWNGDTSFITVVGQVRVMPDSLEAVAGLYRATMKKLGTVTWFSTALDPTGDTHRMTSHPAPQVLLEPQYKVGSPSAGPGLPLNGGLAFAADWRSLGIH